MKVIKFGAMWCNGCLVMKPRWEEIERENPWLKTEFFDYDQDKDAVDKYAVDEELPVAIFVDDEGKEIKRYTGEVKKDELLAAINEITNQ